MRITTQLIKLLLVLLILIIVFVNLFLQLTYLQTILRTGQEAVIVNNTHQQATYYNNYPIAVVRNKIQNRIYPTHNYLSYFFLFYMQRTECSDHYTEECRKKRETRSCIPVLRTSRSGKDHMCQNICQGNKLPTPYSRGRGVQ